MKLDWKRVRLLIWLRNRQTQHAMARHGRGWGAGWQTTLIAVFAVFALMGGAVAGWFLHSSETGILLAWDGWVALVCYLWLSALAAEAQRADPIDTGRLLHLPVSLREAFLINFVSSLYNLPNVIGLAGALGLAGSHAFHEPAAFAALPTAVLFLLVVSAWAQVLRSWFLKVFRNPRRRRWLNIIAGFILALAAQLPSLVNLLNLQFSRRAADAAETVSKTSKTVEEKYDPEWATLPPDTDFSSDNLTTGLDSASPHIYEMPDRQHVYRLTYTPVEAKPGDGNPPGTVIWVATYWEAKDGVWRKAVPQAPRPWTARIVETRGETPGYHLKGAKKATESLDGVPVDLRDLWSASARAAAAQEDYHFDYDSFSPWKKIGQATLRWHAFVPPGWPAWVAASSRNGLPVIPLVAAVAGFVALAGLGLRRAWCIQRDAVLMTERAPRKGFDEAATKPAVLWKPETDKSAVIAKRLPFCTAGVSCLTRAFLRQWGRSVEIRFQIIVACGLASGAVGFGFFMQWADRSSAGAFHVVSSIIGLTCLGFVGLLINFFGYDRGACRAMMLAPAPVRDVLLAKNIAIARLVLLTSLPFSAVAAAVSGEWLMSAVVWILLAPAAVLLFLALGNSSSVANPAPIRLGQRSQARPEGGMGNGCLHMVFYLGIAIILQIPQGLVAASGQTWVGVVTAGVILGGAWGVWRKHWEKQVRALERKFPEVADAVGKATDM